MNLYFHQIKRWWTLHFPGGKWPSFKKQTFFRGIDFDWIKRAGLQVKGSLENEYFLFTTLGEVMWWYVWKVNFTILRSDNNLVFKSLIESVFSLFCPRNMVIQSNLVWRNLKHKFKLYLFSSQNTWFSVSLKGFHKMLSRTAATKNLFRKWSQNIKCFRRGQCLTWARDMGST